MFKVRKCSDSFWKLTWVFVSFRLRNYVQVDLDKNLGNIREMTSNTGGFQYLVCVFLKNKLELLMLSYNNNMNSTDITFLSELGRRLTSVTGDSRETMYLFQRVSLAVQRYSSVAFKGTFLVPIQLD